MHMACFPNTVKLHCVLVIHSFAEPAPPWQHPVFPQWGCWEPLVDSECTRVPVCACVRARVCGLPGFDRLSGRSLLWSPFYSTCSSISASPPQPPSARARGPYNLVCERFSHCPASPSPELSGWPPHSSTLVLSPHWEIIDIAIFNMGFMLRGHYQ